MSGLVGYGSSDEEDAVNEANGRQQVSEVRRYLSTFKALTMTDCITPRL